MLETAALTICVNVMIKSFQLTLIASLGLSSPIRCSLFTLFNQVQKCLHSVRCRFFYFFDEMSARSHHFSSPKKHPILF